MADSRQQAPAPMESLASAYVRLTSRSAALTNHGVFTKDNWCPRFYHILQKWVALCKDAQAGLVVMVTYAASAGGRPAGLQDYVGEPEPGGRVSCREAGEEPIQELVGNRRFSLHKCRGRRCRESTTRWVQQQTTSRAQKVFRAVYIGTWKLEGDIPNYNW